MSAADEFFRALGLEPVEVRVARMAATAKALHNGLSAGFFKNQLVLPIISQ
jgi:hypothetical protein